MNDQLVRNRRSFEIYTRGRRKADFMTLSFVGVIPARRVLCRRAIAHPFMIFDYFNSVCIYATLVKLFIISINYKKSLNYLLKLRIMCPFLNRSSTCIRTEVLLMNTCLLLCDRI